MRQLFGDWLHNEKKSHYIIKHTKIEIQNLVQKYIIIMILENGGYMVFVIRMTNLHCIFG